METVKNSVVARGCGFGGFVGGRAGKGGMNRWSTGDFSGSETILYDTVMVDT